MGVMIHQEQSGGSIRIINKNCRVVALTSGQGRVLFLCYESATVPVEAAVSAFLLALLAPSLYPTPEARLFWHHPPGTDRGIGYSG